MAVHLRPFAVALVASIITFVLTLIVAFAYLFLAAAFFLKSPAEGVELDVLTFVKQISLPFSALIFFAVLLVMVYKGR